MKQQSFIIPAVAGAGSDSLVNVNLLPGLSALVIGAVYTATFANPSQSRIRFRETGQTSFVGVFGPTVPATFAQNVVASLYSSTQGQDPGPGLNPYGVTIGLPKFILQQNFVVEIGAAQNAPGDTIAEGRLIVCFGELEELWAM